MMAKKLPKTLADELKKHDMAINIVSRMDYKDGKKTAPQLVRELKQIRINKSGASHIGDPCLKCGVPHDSVGVGDCWGFSGNREARGE